MNKFINIKLIGLCLVLQFVLTPLVNSEEILPPILDYYPNCAYEVLDSSKVKVKTLEFPEVEVVTRLLLNLREEAKSAGADALILKYRRMKKQGGERSKTFYLSYKAEFIKECNEPHTKNKKLTPVNKKGDDIYGIDLGTFIYELKFPKKAELNRPQITKNEVSIINGLYGIKIGATYQQVIDRFGDPSVELVKNSNELIVGYGRRHWLFFQENTLVNIQDNSPLLSQELVNLIPLHHFFDQYPWKVNKKSMIGSSLQVIQSVLNIKTPLNQKSQLIVSQLGNTFILNFSYSKNLNTGQKDYKLNGFSLSSEVYMPYITNPVELELHHTKIMNDIYTDLIKKKEIDWQYISNKLGEPIGRITLTVNSQINIYNSHLFVKLSHSKLSNINFYEQTLLSDSHMSLSDEHWNFGPFKQGESINQLREFIPETSFESDDMIEIDSDLYNLNLFFDEVNGLTSLYEPKVIIY